MVYVRGIHIEIVRRARNAPRLNGFGIISADVKVLSGNSPQQQLFHRERHYFLVPLDGFYRMQHFIEFRFEHSNSLEFVAAAHMDVIMELAWWGEMCD